MKVAAQVSIGARPRALARSSAQATPNRPCIQKSLVIAVTILGSCPSVTAVPAATDPASTDTRSSCNPSISRMVASSVSQRSWRVPWSPRRRCVSGRSAQPDGSRLVYASPRAAVWSLLALSIADPSCEQTELAGPTQKTSRLARRKACSASTRIRARGNSARSTRRHRTDSDACSATSLAQLSPSSLRR